MNNVIEQSRVSREARPLSPIELKKDARMVGSSGSSDSGQCASGSSACSSPSSYAPIRERVNRK